MKTASFYKVSAIRQQARAGCSVLSLATKYQLAITTVEEILACRTREAAAMLIENIDTPRLVNHLWVVDGRVVDFTNLIGTTYE